MEVDLANGELVDSPFHCGHGGFCEAKDGRVVSATNIPSVAKCKKIQNKLQNKTIHPQIERLLCAEIAFPAQSRHPRGTSAEPLNAAWFPT